MNNTPKKRLTSKTISFRVSAGADIGLTRKTVQMLGNPAFLQFWWNDERQTLFIGACEEAAPEAVPVPDYFYHYTNGQKIKNRKLRKVLEQMMHVEPSNVIRMPGEYIPEMNMVAFCLHSAERGQLQYE
jgi:hypothetical protein